MHHSPQRERERSREFRVHWSVSVQIRYHTLLRIAQVKQQLVAVRVVPVICEHQKSHSEEVPVSNPRPARAYPLMIKAPYFPPVVHDQVTATFQEQAVFVG